MSMIEKQIDELKSLSNNLRYSYGYKSDSDLVDDAIETIQLLSVKLHEQNCHGGWTPVSERLPTVQGNYLVVTYGGKYAVTRFTGKDFFGLPFLVKAWKEIDKYKEQ